MWSFNALLLRLSGLSFGFGPASTCRSPEGVCFSLRQDGVKGAADSWALAHSGLGEGGVQMWGEPVASEAGVTLHQPEARRAFSRGSCPWILGPWQWRAAQVPRKGGVDGDPVLAHRLLGGGSSSLSVPCRSLGSALIAAAHAHLWSSFRQCSESPLLTNPKTIVSCLLCSSSLFPGLPPG